MRQKKDFGDRVIHGNLTVLKDMALMGHALMPQAQGLYGKTYYVNKLYGATGKKGDSPMRAKANITEAEELCVSGRGDMIVINSSGITTANTTSYLDAALTWDKWGITVLGMCAPTMVAQRARISNTSGTDIATLMTISGSNNAFYNLHVLQGGSGATALGCLEVSGDRNYFENCHIAGGGHATPAADAGMFSLKLTGSENTFVNCTIGLDTIVRAAANGELVFDSGAARNQFINCRFISNSITTGKFMVIVTDATSLDRYTIFQDCLFYNFATNHAATLANCFSFPGGEQTFDVILRNCMLVGIDEWDDNDTTGVWVDGAMTIATAEDAGLAVAPVNT